MTIAAAPVVVDAQRSARTSASIDASMRDQRFRGLRHVAVLAQYGPGGLVADGDSSNALCAEVVARTAVGAPVPVTCVAAGDRLLDDASTLVVVVHASVRPAPGEMGSRRLVALGATIHFAGGLEPAPHFFGAAPVIVEYLTTPAGREVRARAIDAALDEVLPWRTPKRAHGMID